MNRSATRALRRIVRLHAHDAAFAPNVAARFAVIEVGLVWICAETLKLLEQVRWRPAMLPPAVKQSVVPPPLPPARAGLA